MTPVSIDAVVDSYAEYLHANHPANFTRFDRTRSSDREAAMAEAIVFQILEELNLSPDINDKVNTGGADFICTGSYRSRVLRRFAKPSPRDRLVVEATSLDLGAVTIRSRIPNDIEDGEGGAFSLVTHSIRNKANDKATQLANYDIPGVLAIASSHAAIAALFNTDAAEYCLVSNPKLMTRLAAARPRSRTCKAPYS